MNKTSVCFIALGVILMIVGCLLFRNLNHVSAVDSHSWTINLNGINSFPWVIFSGFVIFMVGISFIIATTKEIHQRIS